MLIQILYYIFRYTIGAVPRRSQFKIPQTIEKVSFASTVIIDLQKQTATKVYTPSKAIRTLYWIAFQAEYPYSSNLAALIAAKYRRDVAGRLTLHRFHREVVAPIIDITPIGTWFGLRSQLVIGDEVARDDESQRFLTEVAAFFDATGLPVWQINPNSPTAYGNLIKTPQGYKIIDLESGVPSPTPITGSWRRTVEAGFVPMFDDIDFYRLRDYIAHNQDSLIASFGQDWVSRLNSDVDSLELATRLWKSGERRLWGRCLSWLYRRCAGVGQNRDVAAKTPTRQIPESVRIQESENKPGRRS